MESTERLRKNLNFSFTVIRCSLTLGIFFLVITQTRTMNSYDSQAYFIDLYSFPEKKKQEKQLASSAAIKHKGCTHKTNFLLLILCF